MWWENQKSVWKRHLLLLLLLLLLLEEEEEEEEEDEEKKKRRKDNAHCGGRMKSLFEKTSSKEGIFLLYRSHYRAVDIWKDILLIKKVLYKKIKLIKFFYRDVFR